MVIKIVAICAFRRKDGKMIAIFRVQADLKGMETTADGKFVIIIFLDISAFPISIADLLFMAWLMEA